MKANSFSVMDLERNLTCGSCERATCVAARLSFLYININGYRGSKAFCDEKQGKYKGCVLVDRVGRLLWRQQSSQNNNK